VKLDAEKWLNIVWVVEAVVKAVALAAVVGDVATVAVMREITVMEWVVEGVDWDHSRFVEKCWTG
jgi:hypothetical protein